MIHVKERNEWQESREKKRITTEYRVTEEWNYSVNVFLLNSFWICDPSNEGPNVM